MNPYFTTALGRFRAIAFAEGVSYLLLLFIAMPLKYWAGMPMAVKATGWLHGLLFVLFILSLIEVSLRLRWSVIKTGLAFLASLLPFGTFVLDAKLLRPQQLS
jgi:integral membrane protein